MKKEWEYNGDKYVIYDDRKGNLYLNCHLCDCSEVLEGLDSQDKTTSENAKMKAVEILQKLECAKEQDRIRVKKIREDYWNNKESDRKRKLLLENILIWFVGILIVVGFLYILYQLWWFFVGKSAFEGPFADQYSAGETIADSIIFIIILIVVIEEVIRRIMNGHF